MRCWSRDLPWQHVSKQARNHGMPRAIASLPKFSKTSLVVRYNTKLESFRPTANISRLHPLFPRDSVQSQPVGGALSKVQRLLLLSADVEDYFNHFMMHFFWLVCQNYVDDKTKHMVTLGYMFLAIRMMKR